MKNLNSLDISNVGFHQHRHSVLETRHCFQGHAKSTLVSNCAVFHRIAVHLPSLILPSYSGFVEHVTPFSKPTSHKIIKDQVWDGRINLTKWSYFLKRTSIQSNKNVDSVTTTHVQSILQKYSSIKNGHGSYYEKSIFAKGKGSPRSQTRSVRPWKGT